MKKMKKKKIKKNNWKKRKEIKIDKNSKNNLDCHSIQNIYFIFKLKANS